MFATPRMGGIICHPCCRLQVLAKAALELPDLAFGQLPAQAAQLIACFAGGSSSSADDATGSSLPRRHVRTAAFAPSFSSFMRALFAAGGWAPPLPRVVYELGEAAAQLGEPGRRLYTPDGAIVSVEGSGDDTGSRISVRKVQWGSSGGHCMDASIGMRYVLCSYGSLHEGDCIQGSPS